MAVSNTHTESASLYWSAWTQTASPEIFNHTKKTATNTNTTDKHKACQYQRFIVSPSRHNRSTIATQYCPRFDHSLKIFCRSKLLPARIAGKHRARLRASRSAARRLGKECVSTCSTRWSPLH